ncbi:MAG: hypothetical protein ACI38A_06875 [Candidatus Ornithomonoglobus sp.]
MASIATPITGTTSKTSSTQQRQNIAMPSVLSEGAPGGSGAVGASGGNVMTKPRGSVSPMNPTVSAIKNAGTTVQYGGTNLSGPGDVVYENAPASGQPETLNGNARSTLNSGYSVQSGNTVLTGQGDVVYNNPQPSSSVVTPNGAGSVKIAGADGLTAVRQYINNNANGMSVDWDDATKTVNINGTVLKPEYISDDGTAYIHRSTLDNLISQYNSATGQLTPQQVNSRYDSKYGNMYSAALDKLLNREAFSYNPEDDVVYQAYKEQYTRNAEDALRAVLNNNNSYAGGTTGAVGAEALAAYYNNMKQLDDIIPTLAADAYTRYQGETDRLRGNLSDAMSVGNDAYSKLYQQYVDTRDDARYNQSYYDNVQQQIRENNMAERQLGMAERQLGMSEQELAAALAQMNAQTQGQQYSNEAQRIANEWAAPYNEQQLRSMILANEGSQINNIYDGSYKFGAYPNTPEAQAFLSHYGLNYNGNGYVDSSGQSVVPWRSEGDYTKYMNDIDFENLFRRTAAGIK